MCLVQESKGEKKLCMRTQEMRSQSWHQYRIPVLPWASDFEIQFCLQNGGNGASQQCWKGNSINIYALLGYPIARNLYSYLSY